MPPTPPPRGSAPDTPDPRDPWAAAFAHDLRMPFVAEAPEDRLDVGSFLDRMRVEEALAAPHHRGTHATITRLRKVFYNSEGWDRYLIPGAADFPAPYDTRVDRRYPRVVEIPLSPADLRATDAYLVVTDAGGETPPIAEHQDVRTEAALDLDIGHVFAGLDAANHRGVVDGPLHIDLASNLAAATWLGDLGSVLAEVQCAGSGGRAIDLDTVQALIDRYAPPADMLGNVDPYVVAEAYDTAHPDGPPASELLDHYYRAPAVPGHPRRTRFRRFARALDLGPPTAEGWAHGDRFVARHLTQVRRAAAMYIGVNTEGLSRYAFAVGLLHNPLAEHVLRLFLRELRDLAHDEPPLDAEDRLV